jgi:hypothetical protein
VNEAAKLAEVAATTSFDDANALCQAFAEQAPAQSPLSIEDCVGRIADAARPTLVRNLLELDVKRRRAVGETPRAEDYRARLPEFADLIYRIFLERHQDAEHGGVRLRVQGAV